MYNFFFNICIYIFFWGGEAIYPVFMMNHYPHQHYLEDGSFSTEVLLEGCIFFFEGGGGNISLSTVVLSVDGLLLQLHYYELKDHFLHHNFWEDADLQRSVYC